MDKKQEFNIQQYFNYLHFIILLGILFYFVAYYLTVFGLTTGYTYELNPFMNKILFTKYEILFLALFYSGIFTCIILYKFLLIYSWQYFMSIKSWVYWIRALMTASYFAFSLYFCISGFLDMSHNIAVWYGVKYLYG